MSDRPKNRLLVVTYHFPPAPGVGALRWAGFSKYLARSGWEVRVVSAFGEGRRCYVPSVEVEARSPRRTLAARYQRWRLAQVARRQDSATETPPGFRPMHEDRAGPLRKALRKVSNPLLTWPDAGRGWMYPALRATRALIRDFQPTAIVSSGPPHSSHLVVRMARGRSGPPWYMDLRDPWSQDPTALPIDRWLERRLARHVSGMIVTTREFRDLLRGEHPATPIHLVPNGVDLEDLPSDREEPLPGLAVTHLGSLYLGRDPAPVIAAFQRFLEECPEAVAAGSTLRFVGDGDQPWIGRVAEAAGQPSQRVELRPPLPRPRALSLLRGSSIALVLAQNQHEMIPAKLYESIGLGLPTLVITERGSATFHEAARLGAFRAEPDDLPAMVKAFRAVWNGSAGPPDPGSVAKVDHKRIAERVGTLLNGHHSPR